MRGNLLKIHSALVAILCLAGGIAVAEEGIAPMSIVISIAEQKLAVLKDGGVLQKYPISTSKFGVGDDYGSYKTPLGHLRVSEKIGNDLTAGTVFNHRQATREVIPANAPGRDPIVTRILWLDGTEGQNQNARARGIYIHGTAEEKNIGKPVSYGCIRMRSKDVVSVFEEVPLGTPVLIVAEKFPRMAKYEPPKLVKQVAAAAPKPAKPPAIAAGPTPAKQAVVASAASVAKSPAATPTPAPAKAPVVAAVAQPPKPAPAPAPAAKKIARLSPTPTPAPAAVAAPEPAKAPRVVTTAMEQKPDAVGGTGSHAMRGSMLMAGLPDGPTVITTHPSSREPKVATDSESQGAIRAPAAPVQSPFSLRGIARDLSLH